MPPWDSFRNICTNSTRRPTLTPPSSWKRYWPPPSIPARAICICARAESLEIDIRIDGVLQQLGTFPAGQTTDIVTRLKVLANLLTYRTDVPQEGRIRDGNSAVEMRVSTLPTLYGEKAVVRLFATQSHYQYLTDLGLPDVVHDRLERMLNETSGAILIAGPAGSGKTTTIYACLREIVREAAAAAAWPPWKIPSKWH